MDSCQGLNQSSALAPGKGDGLAFFLRSHALDFCLVLVLLCLNFACFQRTINGYFLADDFVHIAWLQKVFQGHFGLIAQNFYANWLKTEGTQFYRPLISLTLVFDWLLWHERAYGYHLANLFFQMASSVFLYLVVKRLFAEKSEGRLVAMSAASLFACYPLHPEVVSWVIGRVDSVCTVFYLASFWLFLKFRQDKMQTALVASLVSFVLSLLSKEMAVTLPPALSAYCFIEAFAGSVSEKAGQSRIGTIKQAIRISWKESFPFWAVVFLYLLVRTLALGTIAGGYSGSIGQGLGSSFFHRFLADGSLLRTLMPFDSEVFSPFDHLCRYLRLVYILIGALFAWRLVTLPLALTINRSLIFAFLWLFISLVPTYQVWNLTEHLQGSRFFYLPSAPFCLLLALLIFPLPGFDQAYVLAQKSIFGLRLGKFNWSLCRYFALCLSILLTLAFMVICQRNNSLWAHAHNEVRALHAALVDRVGKLSPGKKLVLLNLPSHKGGAHEIYNAAMLWVLLEPPLTERGISERVVSFEPMTYGDPDLINITRLKRLLAHAEKYEFYTWDRQLLVLKPWENTVCGKEVDLGGAPLTRLALGEYICSPPIDLPSASYDFIDVELSAQGIGRANQAMPHLPGMNNNVSLPSYLFCYWSAPNAPLFEQSRQLALPLLEDGKPHHYLFAVSEHKSWLSCQRVSQIRLQPSCPQSAFALNKVKLIAGASLLPELAAAEENFREDPAGVARLYAGPLTFNYDASHISGAKSVLFELSPPDAWFEHYSGTLRDKEPAKQSIKTWHLPFLSGKFVFAADSFPQPGFYEIRMLALDSSGKPLGFVSDPINLQIAQEQIQKARLDKKGEARDR